MSFEQIKRNRYVKQTPLLDKFYPPHERQDVNDNDLHSRDHEDDFQVFHLPLSRLHNAFLHDGGIAQGFEVSGVLGAAEVTVDPGVAIDASGQIISLAGRAYTGTETTPPPLGEHDALAVIEADPITLDVSDLAGETVYVTVRFVEIMQDTAESVAGTLEHLPWLKLQRPVDFSDDGMTIILAVAIIHAADGTPPAGTLDDLAVQEAASPNGRHLSGQTVSELRIRQPNRFEESIDGSTTVTISDVLPAATIRAGSSGGLQLTVPDAADTISFARDDGGPFAALGINAGAVALEGDLHVDGSSLFTGNVGINNAAPVHQLDVNGTINATDILRNGSSLVESKWDDAGGGINFSGGRVGVGSAIPAATLDVAGAIKLSGGNTLLFHRTNETGVPNNDGFRLRYEESFFSANQDALLIEKTDGNQSTPDGGIAFVNTGNDGVVETALAIRGNGFVGIGTTTPDRPLTIQGSGGRYLNVKANDGTHEVLLGADNGGGIVSTMSNHDLQLRAGGNSTKMIIKAAGNVGIGTAGPAERLDVNGRVKSGALSIGPWPASGNYVFFGANSLDQRKGGNYALLQAIAGNGKGRTYLNSPVDIRFRINNSERMILAKNGRVGIGITNPARKLHVVGDRIRLTKSGNTGQFIDLRADGSALDLESSKSLYLNNNGQTVFYRVLKQVSSRALKENITELSYTEAVRLLDRLQPVRFNYKDDDSQESHLGFIAEDTPNAIATADKTGISPMNIIAVLCGVTRQQQAQLAALRREIGQLRGV